MRRASGGAWPAQRAMSHSENGSATAVRVCTVCSGWGRRPARSAKLLRERNLDRLLGAGAHERHGVLHGAGGQCDAVLVERGDLLVADLEDLVADLQSDLRGDAVVANLRDRDAVVTELH